MFWIQIRLTFSEGNCLLFTLDSKIRVYLAHAIFHVTMVPTLSKQLRNLKNSWLAWELISEYIFEAGPEKRTVLVEEETT